MRALVAGAVAQPERCRGEQRSDDERLATQVAEGTTTIGRVVHEAALAAVDIDAPRITHAAADGAAARSASARRLQ
jgi:hypothetical protein